MNNMIHSIKSIGNKARQEEKIKKYTLNRAKAEFAKTIDMLFYTNKEDIEKFILSEIKANIRKNELKIKISYTRIEDNMLEISIQTDTKKYSLKTKLPEALFEVVQDKIIQKKFSSFLQSIGLFVIIEYDYIYVYWSYIHYIIENLANFFAYYDCVALFLVLIGWVLGEMIGVFIKSTSLCILYCILTLPVVPLIYFISYALFFYIKHLFTQVKYKLSMHSNNIQQSDTQGNEIMKDIEDIKIENIDRWLHDK